MTTEGQATWRNGVRDVAPIILGIVPFGLIFGVTAADADIDQLAAWASSFLLFAGVSQLAIVEVLGSDGIAITALLTAVVLNSRHLMYSADMGCYTADEPLRTKIGIAYLLTDQAYLVSTSRFGDPDNSDGLTSFYFGAALTLWGTWQITTTAGLLVGNFIPKSWELGFAIPLTFLALLILAVKSKPGLVAAVVGGSVAVATIGLPLGLGLICGAAAGVGAGLISEKRFA
ncbi:MAG: AzlC family ABC transporter permease [Actinomycetota bacterium]|nr:AzlC family ABC transporter permease [Actinomycetota bacterium]